MNERIATGQPYWSQPVELLFTRLGSAPGGLSTAEAERRLQATGPNTLRVHRRAGAIRLFLRQLSSPLVVILIFAAVVSSIVHEWTDAVVILVIVLGSAIITFAQEYSASRAVEELQSRLVHTIPVLRDGRAQTTPAAAIVPGDIVLLSAGSLIPADGVLIEATDFFVNESVLTGETFPAAKQIGPVVPEASIAQRINCVYMGTSVRSGIAHALIVQTGAGTVYGQIADRLNLRPPETEFERGIRRFGQLLTQIMVILVLVVFTLNVISAKPPIDSLLFAIALAVGLSPELLPAIISINLSKGARQMARAGVIVRRLNAIENFGSMDVLCTDKTGTLTEGVVRLDGALDPQGAPSDEVFRSAYLNAALQTGLANALDEAILAREQLDLSASEKLGEVPYDFVRKRLSIAVRDRGAPLLIAKGAFEQILTVCARVREGGDEAVLDEPRRAELRERHAAWSGQGYRVLGVAVRSIEPGTAITHEDEHELTFIGVLLFFDLPKHGAREAIAALARLGVEIKIITGDNRLVAARVADMVGLPIAGALAGSEISAMPDEALWHIAERTTIFAEIDPNGKERIIRALQKTGHVVGYMGDGINDAPALHDADVGISVEGAVDVAREAADFVLLRHDLDVLRRGIEEGRTTFANSLKYIFTTTSANFGNMFSMAGASVFLPFLPLLAKQILLNNFLSDIPAIALAGDSVDRELVETPQRWNITFIRNFMVVFGLISSAFDFLTFGLLYLVIQATPEQFRTGWFIESLLTELLVALVVRTRRPFHRSRPSGWLTLSTLAVVIVTLAIPYLPVNTLLGFVPLPAWLMGIILLITVAYTLVTEAAKRIFFRRLRR